MIDRKAEVWESASMGLTFVVLSSELAAPGNVTHEVLVLAGPLASKVIRLEEARASWSQPTTLGVARLA